MPPGLAEQATGGDGAHRSGKPDDSLRDLDLLPGERLLGGTVHHRAGRGAELTAVTRAVDRAPAHARHRAALVGALGREAPVDVLLRMGDHVLAFDDLAPTERDALGLGQHRTR